MNRFKYLIVWPLANLRHTPWVSGVTVVSIAAAAFVVATLLGFIDGYQQAVRRDVDRLGYDLLITAKGCPYEAATLMLRGGVGLRYMPDGVVERLAAEPAVTGTYPTLIQPVRDPGSPQGMAILKGVSPGLFETLGLSLQQGAWFSDDARIASLDAPLEGVVLGYEAAELEQRHPGDPWLIPRGDNQPPVETRVLGVLARTGTQIDGSILMPVPRVQQLFGLSGKLTGVGVRLDAQQPRAAEQLREAYHHEPELQVVSLSHVERALKRATATLRQVADLLAALLALMAAAVLLNAALIRTLGERQRLFVLHAIGFRRRFIFGAVCVENLALVGAGAGLGVGLAELAGGASSALLASYLPYAPSGDLVHVPGRIVAVIGVAALAMGLLASTPPLFRLRGFTDPAALRSG